MRLTDRDKQILHQLARFRVLSRDQIGKMTCSTVSDPAATVNRIMLRLVRQGLVTPIPRPREQQYLYMPNPPRVQTESAKLRHFLGLADLYIDLGMPKVFTVEPKVSNQYQPDAYTRVPQPVIIEYQRSPVSNKTMQSKIDKFYAALEAGAHDARVLWIASEAKQYKVEIPIGITVAQFAPRLIAAIARGNKPYQL